MTAVRDEAVVGLLARADLLLLAARVLSRPTGGEADEIPWREPELRELARLAAPDGAGPLEEVLLDIADLTRSTDPSPRRLEHTRLFEGPVACPVNETAYVRRDKGVIIADICGFYLAFGFEPDERCGEKPDHLESELEFAAMLLSMAALARARDDDGAAGVSEDALRSFLQDHPGQWLGPFYRRLQDTAVLPLYRRAADLLPLAWDALAGSLGVPAFDKLDEEPDAALPETEGSPYECGQDCGSSENLVTLTAPGLPLRSSPSHPDRDGGE